MSNVVIRPAAKDDCAGIMDLIKELAECGKMSDKVKLTTDALREDCFGEDTFCGSLVAEDVSPDSENKSVLVGYALYSFSYSTFDGRSINMADLFVKPEFRGQGIGSKLWEGVTKIGLEKKCSRLEFIVLDWNKNSIEYYKRRGATDISELEGWRLFCMRKQQMEQFVKSQEFE